MMVIDCRDMLYTRRVKVLLFGWESGGGLLLFPACLCFDELIIIDRGQTH